MKRTLLLLSFFTIFSFGAWAQICTPATVSNAGIYPDSATNFMPAYQGQAYNQLITVKVPADSLQGGIPIPIDRIELVSIVGLPQGLSYSCVPSNCKFPGGETNCAVITGTTNDPVGVYPVTITVEAFVGVAPFVISNGPTTFSWYQIVVNLPNATQNLNPNTFSVSQSAPNPSDNACDIYYTLTSRADVEIRLMNAIGKEVQRIKTNGNTGVNKYQLNTENLPQGIYFYSLFNGQTTVTKRLVVNH